MPQGSTCRFRTDCDGCGAAAPSAVPAGWYARPLDPPCYTGPRQLLFCPACFSGLPAKLRGPWQRLETARSESWLAVFTRRLFHGQSERRRAVG